MSEAVRPTPFGRYSFRRILAARYLVLAALMVAAMVVAGGRGDWNDFVEAGRSLVHHDGLAFYERHGDVQTGPLSLLLAVGLAGTGWLDGFVLCVVLTAIVGLASIALLELSARSPLLDVDMSLLTLLGGLVVVFWWPKLGGYGHLDDALVLGFAAGAVCLRRSGRMGTVAVLVGLAIATKPWAVMFVPLAAVDVGTWRPRLRSGATAIAVGGLAWLPFIVYAPKTLQSLKPTVNVAADSVIALFGGHGEPPSWMRVSQLLLAVTVAALAVHRGTYDGVILAAVAVRLGTDPGTWSYYTPGLVLGAFAWDLFRVRRPVPWTTMLVTVLLLPDWIVPPDRLRAALRLVACLLSISLVLIGQRRTSRTPPRVAVS